MTQIFPVSHIVKCVDYELKRLLVHDFFVEQYLVDQLIYDLGVDNFKGYY